MKHVVVGVDFGFGKDKTAMVLLSIHPEGVVVEVFNRHNMRPRTMRGLIRPKLREAYQRRYARGAK